MDPVSRPEWADPLVVGVHLQSFYTALAEQPTREVLRPLRDDARLVSFLERRPLGKLEFSDRLTAPHWNGEFLPLTCDIIINAFRSPSTYGKDFYPPELITF